MTSPFVAGPPLPIAGAPGGPLTGLTFAAKDLFDVPAPARHAWAVQRLLDAGATLLPVGLSIVGARGSDTTLVAAARAMETSR